MLIRAAPIYREAEELAVERLGDRAADRGLADAWRADEAHDLPLRRADERADGDELEDALLDVFEPVVVFGEDAVCVAQVVVLLRVHPPWERGEPVEVVARHVELGGGGLEQLELGELLVDRLGRVGGDSLLGDPLGELGEERLFVVLLQPELLLDVLELLHQHVLALIGRELVLHLPRDLRLELRELELLLEEEQRLLDPLRQVERREHLLQLLRGAPRPQTPATGEGRRPRPLSTVHGPRSTATVHGHGHRPRSTATAQPSNRRQAASEAEVG